MKADNRQITLAIHTWDHAVALKAVLEREGIGVTLQNVNLENPAVSAGVRVRIPESELPKALRIIENPDIFHNRDSSETGRNPDTPPVVMVPVDFSAASRRACRIGFEIAAAHKARVLLLHAFMNPIVAEPMPLSDTLDFDSVAEVEEEMAAARDVNALMGAFTRRLREAIKHGDVAVAPFDTRVDEGLPEEVVAAVAKEIQPMLIVMGTRGAGNTEPRIMGSVTAEVLDTCRFPVFTVPDNVAGSDFASFGNALFFTTPDQQDIVAIDAFVRILGRREMAVTLLGIPSRNRDASRPLDALVDYCRLHYPWISFNGKRIDPDDIDGELKALASQGGFDILGVPNKKKNLLARFFNPTLAHRLIFVSDRPMLVIPV